MNRIRVHHWAKVILLIAALVMGLLLFLPDSFAQLAVPNSDVLKGSGIEVDKDFGETVLLMVNYFIGFLGFLATLMFIYAGVLWVLNAGSEEMIGKAKKIMTYAALGIVVILLSFSVVKFITGSADGGRKDVSDITGGSDVVCTFDFECPEKGQWCVYNREDRKRECITPEPGETRPTGEGVPCLYDFDCSEGQWCRFDPDSDERKCTADVQDILNAECQVSEGCSGDQVCVTGGGKLQGGERLSSARCVSLEDINRKDYECLFVTDCEKWDAEKESEREICWQNICQIPPDRPRAPFECFVSSNCAAGQYCQTGRCRQATSITCSANADCKAPRTCDTTSGFCRNPDAGSGTACDTSSDCNSGYVCNEGSKRCELQIVGEDTGAGEEGSPAIAASAENANAIEGLVGELDSALGGVVDFINALPEEDQEEIRDALRQGSLEDKMGKLEKMLETASNPAVIKVLERLVGAMARLVSLREEMDDLRLSMPESAETILNWDATNQALDDLIDDPYSGVKLRRFETKYRELRDLIRGFPVVQARIRAIPAEGNVPFTVTLEGLDSVDPTGGTISDYKWTFLDNQGNEVSLGNSPVVIHEFTEPNTYVMRLQASTSRRDEKGYKTAVDGISTVRIKANPPASQVRFRINGAEAEDAHHLTEKEAFAGVIFDPAATVPALGRTIQKYEWDFGDTATELRSTPTTVVHTYPKAGEYFVKLTVTDSHGIKDRRVVKLFIKSLAADILLNPREGIVNTEFQIHGIESRSDSGSIKRYDWSIEDEQGQTVFTGEEQSFFHKFDRPGQYRVVLMVTDVAGSRDNTLEILKVVSRKPVAGFTSSVPFGNHPNRVEFDAFQSYDPDEGDVITYSWDFDGDGSFEIVGGKESKVIYEYREPGNYKTRLQVQDSFGQRDLAEKSVAIDSVLSADINFKNRAVRVGEEAELSVTSPNAESFLWEFGDGETLTTEEKIVKHAYKRMGRYNVKLHFFDGEDREGTATAVFLVGNSGSPVAVIDLSVHGRDPRTVEQLCGQNKPGISVTRSDSVMFKANASINADGSTRLLSYDWTFTDGTTNSKKEFTRRFEELSAPGQCVEAGLVVRDQISGKVSQEDKVFLKVTNALPEITDFLIETKRDQEFITPLTVHLRVVAPKDSDGVIKRYRWWYTREGDEDQKRGTHSTNAPETDLVITAAGQPGITHKYFFFSEVTDNDGGATSTEDRFLELSFLEVKNGPNLSPVAEFVLDKTTILAGDSITFVSQSYDPQGDNLPRDAFQWDFDGDGQFDDKTSGSQVSRQFNTPGEYAVRLKVTHRGLSSSTAKTVFVEPTQNLPQAAFTYSVEGTAVTFDSSNSRYDPDLPDTTLRYEWDFDALKDADGNGFPDDDVESEEARPTFTYAEVGTYKVRLKAKDALGMEGIVVRAVDLRLTEAERERNSYRSLSISSPDQPLASLVVSATPSRLQAGGNADVEVRVFNSDNSDYFGQVYFEVIEGGGEITPNPVDAKNSKAGAIFTAIDPGLVRIQVKATNTSYGDLTEEVTLDVSP